MSEEWRVAVSVLPTIVRDWFDEVRGQRLTTEGTLVEIARANLWAFSLVLNLWAEVL